jgi:hypothetical protein
MIIAEIVNYDFDDIVAHTFTSIALGVSRTAIRHRRGLLAVP